MCVFGNQKRDVAQSFGRQPNPPKSELHVPGIDAAVVAATREKNFASQNFSISAPNLGNLRLFPEFTVIYAGLLCCPLPMFLSFSTFTR